MIRFLGTAARLVLFIAACKVVGWWALPLVLISIGCQAVYLLSPKAPEDLRKIQEDWENLKADIKEARL